MSGAKLEEGKLGGSTSAEMPGLDLELATMGRVGEALASLPNADAQERVLAWAFARFGKGALSRKDTLVSAPTVTATPRGKEIPGIASLSDSGELHLTIRDPKAKSANDAALRIAHVALYSHAKLTGQASASSKNLLVPILRKYRVYDGNTRGILAKHKGLLREGDELSLDAFCQQEAETYIKEILDPSTAGTWGPSSSGTRAKRQGNDGEPPSSLKS
ncbi:MAG: hypothetical protein ACRDFW_06165 [bacterium]